ncbi:MAG: Cell division protein FtsX [Candidatus Saccharibacteria bacterium]|nr:Cell division protein FtsX [Candidatus Saccharibacteria bacterium]
MITVGRIFTTGLKNFARNLTLAVAAMAVMVVTLTIVLFSLITNATFTNTIQTITDRIDVSVYLKDEVTPAQRDKLLDDLKKQPDVASVEYQSKDAVLEDYLKQNPTDTTLQAAVQQTGNTLPATIRIKPNDLNKIDNIRQYLSTPANAALQSDKPSYSGERKQAIDNITHATNVLQRLSVVAVALFALISALIVFNTIQMAIFNRREELTIMRLLGATTNYIRGPFIVESVLYGVLSAIASIAIINAAFAAANNALQATSLGLLDIHYASEYFHENFWILFALQLSAGILLGAASSIIATRRYLKFRTSK